MNLSQFQFIYEVAKFGNITAAAQNLYVSQSAISQAITSLEEELGFQIFQRSRAGVVLTKEGRKIVEISKDILDKIQEIKNISKVQDTPLTEDLKVSLTPGFINLTHDTLNFFKRDYPNMNIEISEKDTVYIIEDIRNKNIDLGLITLPKTEGKLENDLAFKAMFSSPMVVCVNKNSPLASKTIISPIELFDQKIVLYTSRVILDFVDRLVEKYNGLNILLRSNKLDLVKKTVIEENCITVVSAAYADNDPTMKNGDIVQIGLTGFTQDYITYGWIYSKKHELSSTAKEFLRYISS
ncbi:LysR family transcriptional regulator [Bacillus sp. Marseille-P3661]|uniref:LysR family transcriptional regulator n=1 Tax=Bacillus sp. Marseille-P3661 TaxID=1936234 RepID=UPI0015E184E0|nr:LysR family transcriptional regulator [Bacillus sp. Marseille-P3661]